MLGQRRTVEVEGYAHANPVPAAARVGDLIASGSVHGLGEGASATTLDEQCATMFERVGRIVTEAGGELSTIVKFDVWLADAGDRTALNEHWTQLFPDPHDRPARHVLPMQPSGAMLIKCAFLAVSA